MPAKSPDALPLAVRKLPAHPGLELFEYWPTSTLPNLGADVHVYPAAEVPHPCAVGVKLRLGEIEPMTNLVLAQLLELKRTIERPAAPSNIFQPALADKTPLQPGFARTLAALAAWARFALTHETVTANVCLRWALDTVKPIDQSGAVAKLLIAGTLDREPNEPGMSVGQASRVIAAIHGALEAVQLARSNIRMDIAVSRGMSATKGAERRVEAARKALREIGSAVADGRAEAADIERGRCELADAEAALAAAKALRERLGSFWDALEGQRFRTRLDPSAPATVEELLRAAGMLAPGEAIPG